MLEFKTNSLKNILIQKLNSLISQGKAKNEHCYVVAILSNFKQ